MLSDTPGERFGRLRHRAAGHHHASRRVGPGGVRGLAGIAHGHLDAVDVQAELLARDLGERRLQPLAEGVVARAHLDRAARRELHHGLLVAGDERQAPRTEHLGAVRGLLGEGREPDTDQPAVRLRGLLAHTHRVEVDHAPRSGDAPRVVAAVVELAGHVGVRHRIGRNEVLRPHVGRLAPDRPRDRVDGQLHREAHPWARDAAIRREARLVGGDGVGLAAIDVRRRTAPAGCRRPGPLRGTR